jgi:hypothetical protein
MKSLILPHTVSDIIGRVYWRWQHPSIPPIQLNLISHPKVYIIKSDILLFLALFRDRLNFGKTVSSGLTLGGSIKICILFIPIIVSLDCAALEIPSNVLPSIYTVSPFIFLA